MNGCSFEFRPETQKLELRMKQIETCKNTAEVVLYEHCHHSIPFSVVTEARNQPKRPKTTRNNSVTLIITVSPPSFLFHSNRTISGIRRLRPTNGGHPGDQGALSCRKDLRGHVTCVFINPQKLKTPLTLDSSLHLFCF